MSYRQAAVDISKEENSRVIMRVNTDIENEQGQYFIPEQVDEQGAKQQTQKQEQDTPSQHARLSHKRTIDLKQEEDLPKFKEQLQELPPHDFIPLISDLSDFINKRYDEVIIKIDLFHQQEILFLIQILCQNPFLGFNLSIYYFGANFYSTNIKIIINNYCFLNLIIFSYAIDKG